jgi:hypothetical protein
MAAGIIFIVVVQRKAVLGELAQFRFEAAKSLLATSMWLWLFFDSLFAHTRYYEGDRLARVIRAGIASILLWYVPSSPQHPSAGSGEGKL